MMKPNSYSRGFSLLELIVVTGVLASIAGMLIFAFSGMTEHASQTVTKQRMTVIKNAILKFENDTGSLPKYGDDFTSDQLDLTSFIHLDTTTPSEVNSSLSLLTAWNDHPANLWQLFHQPTDGANPSRWNPNFLTKTGWKGPYLDTALQTSFSSQSTSLQRIVAIEDSFVNEKQQWLISDPAPHLPPQYITEGNPSATFTAIAQPILFLELQSISANETVYLLQSAGQDGEYSSPEAFFNSNYSDDGDDIYLIVSRVPNY